MWRFTLVALCFAVAFRRRLWRLHASLVIPNSPIWYRRTFLSLALIVLVTVKYVQSWIARPSKRPARRRIPSSLRSASDDENAFETEFDSGPGSGSDSDSECEASPPGMD